MCVRVCVCVCEEKREDWEKRKRSINGATYSLYTMFVQVFYFTWASIFVRVKLARCFADAFLNSVERTKVR